MARQSTHSSRRRDELQVVHPGAAAIDIGSRFHVVAIPPDRDPQPVRRFDTFTGDLHRLADWLADQRVVTIAMESTGVYWIPVYELLEERGFEVLLVNAREAKDVPGRKTDINDAQWLQRLHAYGLPTARQFSSGSRACKFACVTTPTGTVTGILCFSYPAHAEGVDGDEFTASSRCG